MFVDIVNKIKSILMPLMRQEVLFYFFLAVLMLPNVLLAITESLSPLERICSIVFPLGCYYMITTFTRRLGWSIWLLCPISLLAGVQVVLLYIYGKSVIASDMFLNLVTTDVNESAELLSNLLLILSIVVLLYITPFIIATFYLVRKQKLNKAFLRKNRYVATFFALLGVILLGICYVSIDSFSLKTGVYPINACYNMVNAVSRHDMLKKYTKTSRDFVYKASSSHSAQQREIYIVVIGETSRACNWELIGYNRATNPKLKTIDDLFIFDKVLTEANITHKSVPMLLSSASAENYNIIYNQKSIITAFKEAGFNTAFFSTQAHTKTLTDYFAKEADEYEYIRDRYSVYGSDPYDSDLVECARRVIKNGSQKQLIILHTYGSHFNYASRYPQDMAYFKPDFPISPQKENLLQLLNAYDNTIRYTDSILYSIILMLNNIEDAHTSLIYVSDHGEDIFDKDGDVIFHSSTMPSYYQLHVPMLVWLSEGYKTSYPQVETSLRANLHSNISSSASFFHSILNIAGVETIHRDDTYSFASKSYIERQRLYLDDYYNGVPLMSIDMRDNDFAMLSSFN